jgi:hypothetical protein
MPSWPHLSTNTAMRQLSHLWLAVHGLVAVVLHGIGCVGLTGLFWLVLVELGALQEGTSFWNLMRYLPGRPTLALCRQCLVQARARTGGAVSAPGRARRYLSGWLGLSLAEQYSPPGAQSQGSRAWAHCWPWLRGTVGDDRTAADGAARPWLLGAAEWSRRFFFAGHFYARDARLPR